MARRARKLFTRRFALEVTLAAAASLVAASVFFNEVIFGQGIFAHLDFVVIHIPFRRVINEAFFSGQIPLWTSAVGMGLPLAAHGDSAVFHPMQLFFLMTEPERAIGIEFWFHTALSVFTMYMFCRVSMRMHAWGSLVAGLVFGFSAYMLIHLGFLNHMYGQPWVPILFLSLERSIERGIHWSLLGAIAVAMTLLGGNPQNMYMAILWTPLLLGVIVLRDPRWRRAALAAASLALALVWGALLSAVSVLPQAELARQSSRGGAGLTFQEAIFGSLPSSMLPTVLLPDWQHQSFGENGGWIGIAALALLIPAVLSGALGKSRRAEIFMWVPVAVISLLMTVGPATPLYRLAFETIPGMTRFRFPVRWLYPVSLSLAVLCGFGASLLTRPTRPRRVPVGEFGIAAAVLLLIVSGLLSRFYEDWGKGEILSASLLGLACIGVAAAGAVTRGLRHQTVGLLLALGVFIELFGVSGWVKNPNVKPEDFYRQKWVIPEYVESHPRGRVLAVPPERPELWPEAPERFMGNSGILGGVSTVHAGQGLWPHEVQAPLYDRFLKRLKDNDANSASKAELIRLLGAGYVLAEESQTSLATATHLRPILRHKGLVLYETSYPGERARVVCRAEFEPSRSMVVNRVLGDDFRSDSLILEGARPSAGPRPLVHDRCGEVRIGREDHRSLVVETVSERRAWLVLSDSWYPGWKAFVDGDETPIFRANAFFRAVEVGPGKNQVVFRYEPLSFRLGAAITSVAFILSIAWAAALARRSLHDRNNSKGSGSARNGAAPAV